MAENEIVGGSLEAVEGAEFKLIQNADSVWVTKSMGEFIKVAGKPFRIADGVEDGIEIINGHEAVVGSGEGVEYYQVKPEGLEDDELKRLADSAEISIANFAPTVQKIFVIGIKEEDLTNTIQLGQNTFLVEDSTGGDDGSWNVMYGLMQ